jgi:hypothetical protein
MAEKFQFRASTEALSTVKERPFEFQGRVNIRSHICSNNKIAVPKHLQQHVFD